MKIEVKASILTICLEDIARILDPQEDDTVTIEASSNEDRVVVRAGDPGVNFVEFQVRANTFEPGFASFRIRELSQVVHAYHRNLIIVKTSSNLSDTATISNSGGAITLKTADDVIEALGVVAGKCASFDSCDILGLMSDTQHAQSDDNEYRRSLCGLKFEIAADMKLRAIATNGRCLAVSALQVSRAELKKPEFSVFLPRTAVEFLARVNHSDMTEVLKSDDGTRVTIRTGGNIGHFVTSDSFPQWEQCVPKDPPLLATFNSTDIVVALERAVEALGGTELIEPDKDDCDGVTTVEEKPTCAHLIHAAGSEYMDVVVTNTLEDQTPMYTSRMKCSAPEGVALDVFFDARYLLDMLHAMMGNVEMSARTRNKDTDQLGPTLFKCAARPDFFEVVAHLYLV